MRDPECIAFLQWALPRLRMRWPGYRKVGRQVCKRVARRLVSLWLTFSCTVRILRQTQMSGGNSMNCVPFRSPDSTGIEQPSST